jgi:hypothetical protein
MSGSLNSFMAPNKPVDSNGQGVGPPAVVFIMGVARSGSTLLGTLLGEVDGVFFAGELSEWAHLEGVSTVPRSQPFWEKVRSHVGPVPSRSSEYKRIFEHPAGLADRFNQRRERSDYERLTLDVLEGVATESGSSVIVDSSHYPRRAQVLRRLLGPDRVRLIFLVRRPSSVAQSFRRTGEKDVLQSNIDMMVVSVLAWLTYLSHPRSRRAIVSYEMMVEAPLEAGGLALGRPLVGVDPYRMSPPQVLIGNRFVKADDEVKFNTSGNAEAPNRQERLSDFVQWPLRLAALAARWRPSIVPSPRSGMDLL